MLGREINETPIVDVEHRAREDYERARTRFGHRGKRIVKVIGASGLQNLKFYSDRRGPYSLQHVLRRAFAVYARMLERRHSGNLGNDLPQQLQALGAQLRSKEGVPGDVASRPGEAGDQPVGNGISHISRDDWYRISCPLGSKGAWRTLRHDHVNVETDEVIRRDTQSVEVPVPVLNRDVPALHVAAVLAESLAESFCGTHDDRRRGVGTLVFLSMNTNL